MECVSRFAQVAGVVADSCKSAYEAEFTRVVELPRSDHWECPKRLTSQGLPYIVRNISRRPGRPTAMNQPHEDSSSIVNQTTISAQRIEHGSLVRMGIIGLLVYYGLFASYGRLPSFFQEIPEARPLGIPKLIVFALTMWFVAKRAAERRVQYVVLGAIIAIIGSLLLVVIENRWLPLDLASKLIVRMSVEGIEAVGEALITAGLVAFIRLETSGHNLQYFRGTTSLRIGQNAGMVLAVLAGYLFWPEQSGGYSVALLILRVIALFLVLQFVRARLIDDRVRFLTRPTPDNRLGTKERFRLDALIGTLSYALFYLVAIGSPVILGYRPWAFLALNGGFAVLAMCGIFLMSPSARPHLSVRRMLLTIQTVAAIGAGVVIGFWIVSLWLSTGSPISSRWVLLSAGVLGFFTTATYVIGELSSGLHGKPANRSGQIIHYFALSRTGPVAVLLLILWLPVRSSVSITTVAIIGAVCWAGVIGGVVGKRKYESNGGKHEQIESH